MTTDRPHRKLIEVALPLDEINAACKAEKDRKTGTVRNVHKWFAPMPLPAWRALLFAALVDDPEDDERRAYLLDLIKRLVGNGADLPLDGDLREAQRVLASQFPDGLPIVFDPFCGGGSTLVEGQRLGLPTYGSDLNPVPVLITRVLTEMLPPLFGHQPLHAEARLATAKQSSRSAAQAGPALIDMPSSQKAYSGFDGFERDAAYYAELITEEAWSMLRPVYELAASPRGETPLSWLWSRTAPCPNPACGIETVLTTSWSLSQRKNDLAWIQPRVADGRVALDVVTGQTSGQAPSPPKVGRGASFTCLGCNQVIDDSIIRELGMRGALGLRLTAVATETVHGRDFRAPSVQESRVMDTLGPADAFLDVSLGPANQYVSPPRYGITTQADLYTRRQTLALTTFADLIAVLPARIARDGGSEEWSRAITTFLGLAIGRMAQHQSMLVRWKIDSRNGQGGAFAAFGRHDLPMTWDFVEPSPIRGSGSLVGAVKSMSAALAQVAPGRGTVVRADARTTASPLPALIATDPPYFDAIPYADLSDYFYVWHRRAMRNLHPDLYATVAAPKAGELTAFAGHHGGIKDVARDYFIGGFTETFRNLEASADKRLPMLVVYASKEQAGGSEEQTRWSSILTAIVEADLEITGTWPVLGTGGSRMRGLGANAVAMYVVMVCRPRLDTAGTCSLADLNRALRRELKPAVHDFQAAGILPVDLAQSAMGPGMQVYSRYRAVHDQSGRRVSVEQAIGLINAALGEVLDEQEGELDPYSRFAVAWWEKHGWLPAPFGEADQLARPQGLAVDDAVRAGVIEYPKPGFVAALGAGDMDRDWKPSTDRRPTAWEAVHHLADRLIEGGGAQEASRLLAELSSLRDPAQALVYRLHEIATRRGWTKDQERYNALIGSWSDLLALSATAKDGLF